MNERSSIVVPAEVLPEFYTTLVRARTSRVHACINRTRLGGEERGVSQLSQWGGCVRMTDSFSSIIPAPAPRVSGPNPV